jgi:hypothetical protein
MQENGRSDSSNDVSTFNEGIVNDLQDMLSPGRSANDITRRRTAQERIRIKCLAYYTALGTRTV